MVTQNTTLHSSRPGSLIHLLAEETWDRCWSLADQSDLPNLTLVCSQFRRICQEKLFRHLAIMHRAYPDRIPPHGTPLKFKKAQISRWIKRTREIESWPLSTSVKELSFMNYLTPPMGMLPELLDLHTQFLRTFGEALGAFSNLTQLRLSDIEINRTIYRNLTSLVKLQSVELFSCPISSDCFPRQVLELKKLSIIAPPEDTDTGASIAAGNFSLVNLKTLEELDLTFDVHGGIDFLRAVAAIVPNPGETRLQALTNLEITWDSWLAECLPLILEECPQLESLDIGAYEADLLTPAVDTAALELSSTLIPHLRKLRCMAEHVPILAPGRPVTQVRISSGYDKDGRFSRQNTDMQALAAAVDALSRTSAPVVELDLDPELLSSPRMLPSIFRAVQALNDLDILTFTISEPHWFLLRLIRTNLGSGMLIPSTVLLLIHSAHRRRTNTEMVRMDGNWYIRSDWGTIFHEPTPRRSPAAPSSTADPEFQPNKSSQHRTAALRNRQTTRSHYRPGGSSAQVERGGVL
ncbi:hypothetical protein C8F01DRAFT_268240 [Mycena amicta]|nr:hypothetical protein C8F01DRAFT_268240 [Mycena amicta]